MNDADRDLMSELDRPAVWIDARVRLRRAAVRTWLAATTAGGLMALLSDNLLLTPLLPSLVAALSLAGQWSVARWWQACSGRAGHPIVWANVPWTLVMGRPVPDGRQDKGVPGTLHRIADAWVWRPSVLFAENIPPRRWPHQVVAVLTVTRSGACCAHPVHNCASTCVVAGRSISSSSTPRAWDR
ncbi:MAG TPA: hypothetical protein VES02_09835 [Dermatophilaceae bacterium]|nr:hypothetical protein [Dermatophilaceae bacterium]